MALSANKIRATRNPGANSYKIADGVKIYAGALVGLNTNTGYLDKWQDNAYFVFLGLANNNAAVVGETSDSPMPECLVNEEGVVLTNVSVTGVTAVTNTGDLVYATDDNTLTLSANVHVYAIGKIVRWISSTYCDVQLFTPNEYLGVSAGSFPLNPTSPT